MSKNVCLHLFIIASSYQLKMFLINYSVIFEVVIIVFAILFTIVQGTFFIGRIDEHPMTFIITFVAA